MVFFGKSKDKKKSPPLPPLQPGVALAVNWAKLPNGKFFRLIDLDPEETGLSGQEGIYVVWHAGLRPEWVYLGASKNLAATMHSMAKNNDVMKYELSGGLFTTWALIDEGYRDGILKFLNDKLDPAVDNPDLSLGDDITPIPVIPPGLKVELPADD